MELRTAQVAANTFIKLAKAQGKRLTNMQVQKLVYIAQGFSLAIHDEPIYVNNTHAWQWGPVIPKLYKDLQKYGSGEVTAEIPGHPSFEQDAKEYGIIEGVWKAYGQFSGIKLSELTHQEGTPWAKIWASAPFSVIPNDVIKEHYRGLISQE